MDVYDVALWLEWPTYTFPLVALVEAEDGIEAIEMVMRFYNLESVLRAAYKLQGHSFITRYHHLTLVDNVLAGETIVSMA